MNKNLTNTKSNKTGSNVEGIPGRKIMKNMIKTLKCDGLWKQEHPYSLCHPSTLLFITSLLFTGNLCLSELLYTFKSNSILEIAEAMGPAIACFGIMIKFCDLFVHRVQFFQLVTNLQNAFDEVSVYVIKLAFGFSNQASLQLPNKLIIFYTSGITNRLIIDYIITTICSLTSVLLMAPLDCYVGCTSLYIISHIKILKEQLKNISYVTKTRRESDARRRNMCLRSEVYVEERLLQFIKYHQRVISFVDQLEEVCNRQMMVHFLYTTLQLCLVFFEATNDIHNAEKMFSYGLASFGSFSQLLICTYYGQQLLNEASRLEFAVYNIAWFDKSAKFKRLIPLILMRVQKPLGVTAFKYCPVSMVAFVTVLKTVMSYLTLLQQVTENMEKN